MAFLVEDGTVIIGANAGITVAFADNYHLERGNALWTGINAVKEACIIRATGYVEQRFRHRFRGYRRNPKQTVSWPRNNALDNHGHLIDGLPFQWQYGLAEYALRALLYGELAPDVPSSVPHQNNATGIETETSETVTTGQIQRITERFGPFEETTSYFPSSTTISQSTREIQSTIVDSNTLPAYPAADLWLQELITSSSIVSIPFARA